MGAKDRMWNARRGIPYLLVLLLLLVALGGGAAAGVLGYIWITGGSGEASLSAAEALATREAEEASVVEAVGTVVVEAVNVVIAQVADMGATLEAGFSGPVEFRIEAAESEASFAIEEDLRGSRVTVIGSTSEVGGRIMVDMADPAKSSIGAILINARTLQTDIEPRNRALRGQILKSAQDEYEFIVFEPRALSNFSADSVSVGETISFDITGDLTIVEVTNSVTFKAQVTVDSESQISGSAAANVLYADFNLAIPNSPSVTWLADDVDLRLDFVARAG